MPIKQLRTDMKKNFPFFCVCGGFADRKNTAKEKSPFLSVVGKKNKIVPN